MMLRSTGNQRSCSESRQEMQCFFVWFSSSFDESADPFRMSLLFSEHCSLQLCIMMISRVSLHLLVIMFMNARFLAENALLTGRNCWCFVNTTRFWEFLCFSFTLHKLLLFCNRNCCDKSVHFIKLNIFYFFFSILISIICRFTEKKWTFFKAWWNQWGKWIIISLELLFTFRERCFLYFFEMQYPLFFISFLISWILILFIH